MTATLFTTLKTGSNDYLQNTGLGPITHVNYTVPSSPGTNEAITIENVADIQAALVLPIRDQSGVPAAAQDFVVTTSGNVVTVANGTTFALAQSQVIDLIIIGTPQ